jgi:hypothetical protein
MSKERSIMCSKKEKKNALNSNDVSLLWYFEVHVSADNPAIFKVTFQLKEHSVTECVKLLHNIEIYVMCVIQWWTLTNTVIIFLVL